VILEATMKQIKLSLLTVLAVLWAGVASAQVTNNYSFNVDVNQNVTDANASGLTSVGSFTGMVGEISDISVSLNLGNAAGDMAFNGDLYAYLTGPNGGYAVLLNRVGVSGTGTPFGYSDTGFKMTFVASGNDIHFYQNFSYSLNGSGQLTGTWGADGRAIDPASPPSLFDITARTATLDSFTDTDPNGVWTLFLADLSAGSQDVLNDWTVNIITVPEPPASALLVTGALLLVCTTRKFRRNRSGGRD
jgi:subtilisin-like proprotein convertase family protein